MAGTVDYVRETLEKSYALIKSSGQGIFIDMLKIGVAEAFVGLAALLLIGGLAFVLLGASLTQIITTGTMAPALMQNILIGIVIAFPIIIIAALAGAVLKSIPYNIIDNASAAKPTDLVGTARKNLLPLVKLSVLMWAVMLAFALPIILSLILGGQGGVAQTLVVLCVVPLICALAFVLFGFFAQFSTLEVVLKGNGPIAAIKASASLVKNNIWGVLLIDIVILIAAMAVSVVSSIAQTLLRLLMQLLAVGGTAGLAAGFAIYLIGMLAVSSVISALVDTVIIPVAYNFWKGKGS
jgi:hypothetical protein